MGEAETTDTRFQPGQSGNPNGRPKGSRTKTFVALDTLGEGVAEDIVKALAEKAKGGDVMAGRAILDRIWPARKGRNIQFDLPAIEKAEDLPKAIAGIAQQVADGDLSPDEGALIVGLLETQRRAIETSDHATRLTAIEEALKLNR